jgi:DNA-binding CsgD family transcriptional regulator
MKAIASSSTTRKIWDYLLWYRLATLAYVAILGVALLPIIKWLLMTAVVYSVIIYVFRRGIFTQLQERPYLLGLDFIATALFMYAEGPETPYYLYSYATLLTGSLLHSYRGAILFAGSQFMVFTMSIYAHGFDLNVYRSWGEHLVTYVYFYLIAALGMAYIAELAKGLDEARLEEKAIVAELDNAKKCLALSLIINQLSLRETQVLTLSASGMSVEKIAGELGISKNTVKSYLKRTYEKLNISSKPELVSMVARQSNEES